MQSKSAIVQNFRIYSVKIFWKFWAVFSACLQSFMLYSSSFRCVLHVKPLNSNELHREVQNWTAVAELTVWRLCCERLLRFVHYYCKNHYVISAYFIYLLPCFKKVYPFCLSNHSQFFYFCTQIQHCNKMVSDLPTCHVGCCYHGRSLLFMFGGLTLLLEVGALWSSWKRTLIILVPWKPHLVTSHFVLLLTFE